MKQHGILSACIAVLWSVIGYQAFCTVQAAQVITSVDIASARDTGPANGTFDFEVSPAPVGTNGFEEYRTALEFDISSLAADQTIGSATLRLHHTLVSDPARIITLYGYPGDGTIDRTGFTDFTAGVPLGSQDVASGPNTVEYDVTSFIRDLIDSGRMFSGFNLRDSTGGPLTVIFVPDGELTQPVLEVSYELPVVDFENLPHGLVLTNQLTMQGIQHVTSNGEGLVVLDEATGTIKPRSGVHLLSTQGESESISVMFHSLRKRVGFYFSPPAGSNVAVLQAYDENGQLLEEKNIPAVFTHAVDQYIEIETQEPQIDSIMLAFNGVTGQIAIDDMQLEPLQDAIVSIEPYELILLAPNSTQGEKIAALENLLLLPSTQTSELLQSVAVQDPDPYVRETSVMTLAQLYDPASISALVDIAASDPDRNVVMAAYNAVWELRSQYGLPDPPAVVLEAIGGIVPGEAFEVQATITSPVDRDNVRMQFSRTKLLRRLREQGPVMYRGPLEAEQPVVLRASFIADEAGKTVLDFRLRLSLNAVDAITYQFPLYIDVTSSGGTASTEPFAGLDEPEEHILSLENLL